MTVGDEQGRFGAVRALPRGSPVSSQWDGDRPRWRDLHAAAPLSGHKGHLRMNFYNDLAEAFVFEVNYSLSRVA